MGKEARAPARSSRLCIKNLPKHITEARFREVFAAHGDVTDAKIVSTKYGASGAVDCSRITRPCSTGAGILAGWGSLGTELFRKPPKLGQSPKTPVLFGTAPDGGLHRGYFDQTFIDTSRITVEFALAVGDNRLSRPWSQHSKGSSRHEKKHPELYERKPENEPV